jgi:hypothetical protein
MRPMPSAKPYPRVIEQHDYMSLDMGQGRRFTAGWSGFRATGSIPGAAFDAIAAYLDGHEARGETFGESFRRLADPDLLRRFWPEWDAPARQFSVGDRVSLDLGRRRGVVHGEVVALGRRGGGRVDVRFDGERAITSVQTDSLLPA